MSQAAGERPDIDAIVVELKARVAERQRRGEYPPDLDEKLGGHWRAVSAALPAKRLDVSLRRLDLAGSFDRGRIPTDSAMPLGSQIHKMVARATTRQVDGIITQMREYADATRAMFDAVLEELPAGGADSARVVNRILRRLDALEEDMDAMRRGANDVEPVATLGARVERLEAESAAREFHPWYSRDDFEDRFRGTSDQIKERYRPLIARFAGHSPVVDVGCGAGLMLELLEELGVEATGVDVDGDLVARCVARGLRAVVADGTAYVESLADHSLGGVFSAQVVEHLQPQELLNLVAALSQKVREGGLVVIETLNSQSLYVHSHAYPLDPTHVRLVPALYLEFLMRQAGFREVMVEWRSPVGDDEALEDVDLGGDLAEAAATMSRNRERLQRLLFAEQDYAVIGTR